MTSGGTNRAKHAATLALFAAFMGVLLVAAAGGVATFGAVTDAGAKVSNTRAALSVIANQVRAHDAAGCVRLAAGPEGCALVLVDSAGEGSDGAANASLDTAASTLDAVTISSMTASNNPNASDAARAGAAASASTTFELRIYLAGGQIVEEYVATGTPFDPENATPLQESNTFKLEISSNILTLKTDQGQIKIALRSAGALTTSGQETVNAR